MDESSEKWLSYLENEECPLFNENDMNPLMDDLTIETTTLVRNMGISSSVEEITGFVDCNSDLKQHAFLEKPLLSSPMSYILSFEDSTVVPKQYSKEIQEMQCNRKPKRVRSYSQTQHHIMAERKRREDLTRMFIALSAIIPGLKKIDKASILKDTIDYVKYLQNRVKDLEEERKKRRIESVACFKMNKQNIVSTVAEDFSCTSDGLDKPIKISSKVEARASANDVLIRVTCEKQKHIIPKLLAKLAAHNLSVVSTNVFPFGNSTLNITCIAQMDRIFSTTMDDLVKLLTEDLLGCCNLEQ